MYESCFVLVQPAGGPSAQPPSHASVKTALNAVTRFLLPFLRAALSHSTMSVKPCSEARLCALTPAARVALCPSPIACSKYLWFT